jgi:hypothetical protein
MKSSAKTGNNSLKDDNNDTKYWDRVAPDYESEIMMTNLENNIIYKYSNTKLPNFVFDREKHIYFGVKHV